MSALVSLATLLTFSSLAHKTSVTEIILALLLGAFAFVFFKA